MQEAVCVCVCVVNGHAVNLRMNEKNVWVESKWAMQRKMITGDERGFGN